MTVYLKYGFAEKLESLAVKILQNIGSEHSQFTLSFAIAFGLSFNVRLYTAHFGLVMTAQLIGKHYCLLKTIQLNRYSVYLSFFIYTNQIIRTKIRYLCYLINENGRYFAVIIRNEYIISSTKFLISKHILLF